LADQATPLTQDIVLGDFSMRRGNHNSDKFIIEGLLTVYTNKYPEKKKTLNIV